MELIIVIHGYPSLAGNQVFWSEESLTGSHVSSCVSLQMVEELWEKKVTPYAEHLSILARINFVFLERKGFDLTDLPSCG